MHGQQNIKITNLQLVRNILVGCDQSNGQY